MDSLDDFAWHYVCKYLYGHSSGESTDDVASSSSDSNDSEDSKQ